MEIGIGGNDMKVLSISSFNALDLDDGSGNEKDKTEQKGIL